MANHAEACAQSTINDTTPRRFDAGSQFGGTVRASIAWVRSRRCEANACVEAARAGDEILVRSSTDAAGPVLRFTADEWIAFVGGVRDGDFDFGLTDQQTASAG